MLRAGEGDDEAVLPAPAELHHSLASEDDHCSTSTYPSWVLLQPAEETESLLASAKAPVSESQRGNVLDAHCRGTLTTPSLLTADGAGGSPSSTSGLSALWGCREECVGGVEEHEPNSACVVCSVNMSEVQA